MADSLKEKARADRGFLNACHVIALLILSRFVVSGAGPVVKRWILENLLADRGGKHESKSSNDVFIKKVSTVAR